MTVEQLIEQLKQLDPKALCVFAEYTSQHKTLLWYLGLCCNAEHQEKQKQVWFSRNLLVQE